MDFDKLFKDDQTNAGIADLARMHATYYRVLVDNGVPLELAHEMTVDFHWLMSLSSSFKDHPNPPRR